MRIVVLIVALSGFAAAAEPDVSVASPAAVTAFVPVPLTGSPGVPVVLTGPGDATWEHIGKGTVSVLKPQCFISGDKGDSCLVLCRTAAGVKVYSVTFSGEPGPGPAPVPPTPPDALTKALTDAFAADGRTKPEALKLASLYRAAAVKAKDASVLNYEALAEPIRNSANTLIGSNLMAVRKVVAGEIKAIVGDAAKPFTAETRAATAKLFDAAAAVLEKLGE